MFRQEIDDSSISDCLEIEIVSDSLQTIPASEESERFTISTSQVYKRFSSNQIKILHQRNIFIE
jgi:hypothetical protein